MSLNLHSSSPNYRLVAKLYFNPPERYRRTPESHLDCAADFFKAHDIPIPTIVDVKYTPDAIPIIWCCWSGSKDEVMRLEMLISRFKMTASMLTLQICFYLDKMSFGSAQPADDVPIDHVAPATSKRPLDSGSYIELEAKRMRLAAEVHSIATQSPRRSSDGAEEIPANQQFNLPGLPDDTEDADPPLVSTTIASAVHGILSTLRLTGTHSASSARSRSRRSLRSTQSHTSEESVPTSELDTQFVSEEDFALLEKHYEDVSGEIAWVEASNRDLYRHAVGRENYLRKAVAKMKQLRQTVGQSNFEAEGGGNVRDEEHIARKDAPSGKFDFRQAAAGAIFYFRHSLDWLGEIPF